MIFIVYALSVSCKQKVAEVKFQSLINTVSTKKGEKSRLVIYKFQNNGNDSLRILSATGECGCTELKFSKTAVAPGMYGVIAVTYDNKDTHDTGYVSKKMVIRTNTIPSFTPLYLNVNVK